MTTSPDTPVFLMCPPEHYAIDSYPTIGVANDMSIEGARVYSADPAGFRRLAMRKWEAFREVLVRELGAEIIEIEAQEDLCDQVFSADASISLTMEDGASVALLSRFTYDERQREVELHAEYRAMGPTAHRRCQA